MNVSEQRTDWPPYLRLQVSDLMMGGGGDEGSCCHVFAVISI